MSRIIKKKQNFWGMEMSVDLYECNPNIIKDASEIETFVYELCDLIKMKRYGDPVIVDFGEEERVSGYSMFQLIETSNISGHFVNQTNNAYLNIFSCKKFDADLVEDFAQKYFEAKRVESVINYRR